MIIGTICSWNLEKIKEKTRTEMYDCDIDRVAGSVIFNCKTKHTMTDKFLQRQYLNYAFEKIGPNINHF